MPRVLLISTYELGRQPFGLASPAAWLREAGVDVGCVDVSRQPLEAEAIASADAIGFYLPMHTATRLALPIIARARAVNRDANLTAFGLYAPLNAEALHTAGIEAIFGGEFEEALTQWVLDPHRQRPPGARARTSSDPGRFAIPRDSTTVAVPRLHFKVPDRSGLPPLSRYATLQLPDGSRRIVGYTEASRGCKHRCRHCPIVPIYQGRFRVVSPDVVLADIRAQVNAGATHVTFGDPDFLNGVGHARAVLIGFAGEFPGVTYDVTAKVEHLLTHRDMLPLLASTGCAFVTSAVESVDDRVLTALEKGHTSADLSRVVEACRDAGLPLAPTFVPFTPWTTLDGYLALLTTLVSLDLVESVASIQLAIRLLVPGGSRLLELEDVRRVVGRFDRDALVYPWAHPDPRLDQLQRAVESVAGDRINAPRRAVFEAIWRLAHEAAESIAPELPPLTSRAIIPFLTEPWYC